MELNDIETIGIYYTINKGDKVEIGREVKDSSDKRVFRNGIPVYSSYKTVIADKDYGSNIHRFIMDNTKELQEEAKILYDKFKNIKKQKSNKRTKTIIGFHVTPHKFSNFMYGINKTSGQIGAWTGFFFFKDIKYAQNYAYSLKDSNESVYIYECTIKIGNVIKENGANIGTGWRRTNWLERANDEGYDTAIIEDADTGYGITDEIIVFDDDNIIINKINEYKN